MDVEAQTRSFLDEAGEHGIARTIDFKPINGQPGRAVLGQVVQHVVNHSSYHRGPGHDDAAPDRRRAGEEPRPHHVLIPRAGELRASAPQAASPKPQAPSHKP